ncbi:hypothetical protein [Amycolatopsis sp. cmx-11-32]|uniref:hypothetical protein n=1 Tax=Amycolatopsis sp. cmx-11-32 TaxID=2785796 RepID=UPI0039E6BE98
MAKNSSPVLKTGGGALWKVVGLAVVVALLALVVKHPAESADWAKTLGAHAGDAIDGLSTFIESLGR